MSELKGAEEALARGGDHVAEKQAGNVAKHAAENQAGNVAKHAAENQAEHAAENEAKKSVEEQMKKYAKRAAVGTAVAAGVGVGVISTAQRSKLEGENDDCNTYCLPSNWGEFSNQKVTWEQELMDSDYTIHPDWRKYPPKVYPNDLNHLGGQTIDESTICKESIGDGKKCKKYCENACKKQYDPENNLAYNIGKDIGGTAWDTLNATLSGFLGSNWSSWAIGIGIFILVLLILWILIKMKYG